LAGLYAKAACKTPGVERCFMSESIRPLSTKAKGKSSDVVVSLPPPRQIPISPSLSSQQQCSIELTARVVLAAKLSLGEKVLSDRLDNSIFYWKNGENLIKLSRFRN